jgi:hypothetical protein
MPPFAAAKLSRAGSKKNSSPVSVRGRSYGQRDVLGEAQREHYTAVFGREELTQGVCSEACHVKKHKVKGQAHD